MVSIIIKGSKRKREPHLVKLEMIFYLTGYNRTPKVLDITGLYEDWSNDEQRFTPNTKEANAKNIALLELKQKYIDVAQEWDINGIKWSPRQLSQCFDENRTNKEDKDKGKVISAVQLIDDQIKIYSEKERIKNGMIIKGSTNAKEYVMLKNSLTNFTQKKYRRSFNTYFFLDIDEQFVSDYMVYLQKRGIENGNDGAVVARLKKLHAVCNEAFKKGMPGATVSIFNKVKENMEHKELESKAIPYPVIQKIMNLNRDGFSKVENFHIDMFLFSFYAGGMANIDVAFLTHKSIKDNYINYERMKFPKKAKMPLLDNAKEIIDKYAEKCYDDYVLPIFSAKHETDKQKFDKVERITNKLNKTLEKVRKKNKVSREDYMVFCPWLIYNKNDR